MKKEHCKIEGDLIMLAYVYLCKKYKKSKRELTTADLFDTCELILKKIELKNRKKHFLSFKSGTIEFGDTNA